MVHVGSGGGRNGAEAQEIGVKDTVTGHNGGVRREMGDCREVGYFKEIVGNSFAERRSHTLSFMLDVVSWVRVVLNTEITSFVPTLGIILTLINGCA